MTVVDLEDAFGQDVFEIRERSTQRGDEAGIDRWAVLADGIKR